MDDWADSSFRATAARCLIETLCVRLDDTARTDDTLDVDTTNLFRQASAWLSDAASNLGSEAFDRWREWKHSPSVAEDRRAVSRSHVVSRPPRPTEPGDDGWSEVFTLDVDASCRPKLRAAARHLGVQLCTSSVPARDTEGLPIYVERLVDREIDNAIQRSFADEAGLHIVLLDGPSVSGKTRAAIRALGRRGERFRFVAPMGRTGLAGWLAAAEASPNTHLVHSQETWPKKAVPLVLFLDQLERFAPRSACELPCLARLRVLADKRSDHRPIVLVATAGGSGVRPLDPPIAELLGLQTELFMEDVRGQVASDTGRSTIVTMSHAGFETEEALGVIARDYDVDNNSEWSLIASRGEFISALWAGRWLERRYRDGMSVNINEVQVNPRGQAVAWAALLLRSLGGSDWLVPREILAAVHQLRNGFSGPPPSNQALDDALVWATSRGPDGRSALVRAEPVNGVSRYRAPAFLTHLVTGTDELAPDQMGAAMLSGGASADVVDEVQRRLCGAALQDNAVDAANILVAEEVSARKDEPGGTKGSGAPRQLAMARGADLRFDRGYVQARVRAAGGRVVVAVRILAPAAEAFASGIAIVLRSPATPDVQRASPAAPSVIIDRSSGPAWCVETGLRAPDSAQAWVELAQRIVLLPVGRRE